MPTARDVPSARFTQILPPPPLINTFPRLCSAPSDCAPKHPLGGGASCGASLALSCSVRMREDASQCLSSEIHVCIRRLHRRPRGLQEARRLWEKGAVCNWLNKSRETEFPSQNLVLITAGQAVIGQIKETSLPGQRNKAEAASTEGPWAGIHIGPQSRCCPPYFVI